MWSHISSRHAQVAYRARHFNTRANTSKRSRAPGCSTTLMANALAVDASASSLVELVAAIDDVGDVPLSSSTVVIDIELNLLSSAPTLNKRLNTLWHSQ
jgi:hypothetical protein